MQVNPVGVQSYQQLNRQENTARRPDDAVKSNNTGKVTIDPAEQSGESRLAVKVPRGSYAENLSEAELKALDLLFSRFADSERFGPGYSRDANTEPADAGKGNLIDLKV